MVLSVTIVNQIRDEIGEDTDYSDSNLEDIYVDGNRGNYSVLNTALIVWRRRLHNLQARSFDVATEGSLLSRHQRIKFIERRIKELEFATDGTIKGDNWDFVSTQSQDSSYTYTPGSGEY